MMKSEFERLEGDEALAARQNIFKAIDAFNDRATGLAEPAQPLALVVRDPATTAVAGGLYGISYYRWLFIELLIIPDGQRRRGVGTQLMAQAEAVARERGCIGVWLDTFSFQARGFYEKLGYRVIGELSDYPPGHSRFWLKKRLDGEHQPG